MKRASARWSWVEVGALVLGAAVAFRPVLRNGFVNWDDPTVLVDNPHLSGPRVAEWAFTTTLIGHYQPLAWLTWSAVKSAFGLSPTAFHALSLAVHVLNGVLVYMVALRLTERSFEWSAKASAERMRERRSAAALFSAAIFLLHPVQVEAVAWASAFPYVLSLTLLLASLLAYLDERRYLSIACYAASLLVRASAIGFPLVLLLVDLYSLAASPQRRDRLTQFGSLVRDKVPFAVLAAVAAVAETKAREVASLQDAGIGVRLTMAATAPFVYLWRLVFPERLTPLDALPIAPTVEWLPLILGVAALAATTVVAWKLRRRTPAFAVGWLAYVCLLGPVAGLTPSGLQATADRYLYIPNVVVSILAGAAIARLLTIGRRIAAAAAFAAIVGLLVLGTLTWRQTQYWRDSIALWTRAAAVDPRNDVATYNLAIALAEAGRDEDAIGRYEETLRLVPDHDLARQNLALLQAARAEREGDRLAQAGRVDEARDEYTHALALDPKRSHAHAARGMLMVRRAEFRDAASDLRAAIDGGVKDPAVANALAFALTQTGNAAEAVAALGEAAAAHPDDVNVKHNLARLLATASDPRVRDGPRALRLALEVCEKTASLDPRALDTLAAAYAAVNRFDMARATAVRAAARARELGDRETALEIEARSRRYGQ